MKVRGVMRPQYYHSNAGNLTTAFPNVVSRKRKRAASVLSEFDRPETEATRAVLNELLLRDYYFSVLHYHPRAKKLAADMLQQNDTWKATFGEANAMKLKWKKESEELFKLWQEETKKVLKLQAHLAAQESINEELRKAHEYVEGNGDGEELKTLRAQLEARRQERIELKRLLEEAEERTSRTEELFEESYAKAEELGILLFDEQNMRMETDKARRQELATTRAENNRLVKELRREVNFERLANKSLILDHKEELEGQAQAAEEIRKNMQTQKVQADQLLKKIQSLDRELIDERRAGREMRLELEGAKKTIAGLQKAGNLDRAVVAKVVMRCCAAGLTGEDIKALATFAAED